ncbi:hemolysin family protein [Gottfriedia acidiceleris]|uniref:Hemolysin family protein n=1 Tax=Gottfriedia acidiceleris TaxID=371036 RepID=A0ABY4JI60_9BACI|nr:hemolysin family protein [Gottfriedia acidiceleris]UPM53521.1 hemolysin family protein [Gottfriedia acidiceleris]
MSDAPSGNGIKNFLNFINRLFSKESKDRKNVDSKEKHLLTHHYLFDVDVEEQINLYEDELFLRTITFKEKKVNDILTPRTNLVAVDLNESVHSICNLFLQERYSRIPVYEQDIDHIIGVISEREFLTQLIQKQTVTIHELIREPIFVMETMKISTVLKILQKQNAHLAIVVDEFGGTSGIVTLEDIIEELVGEIRDEFDEKEEDFFQINENEYQFQASIDLSSFFNRFKIKKPSSRYLTLGGWLFESFKHIPKNGELLQYKNLTFIIKEVQNRRIQSVIVKINHLQSKLGS